jgi:ribonuclease R
MAEADWQSRDPHYEQERLKYPEPAPSREYLRMLLSEAGEPLSREALIERGGISGAEALEGVERRLMAMVRDGELAINRKGAYGLVERMHLVRGRVIAHRDGFGFLVPEDGGDDIFLPARQMRELFHGDRVLVRIRGEDRRGRREGVVVEVLERHTQQVVGRFYREQGVGIVLPENPRLTHQVVIPPEWQGEVSDGQIVVADIVEPPSKRGPPLGRIREVLGEHMAPGMEIEIAIRSYGIPARWPDAVEAECTRFGTRVNPADKAGRVDLRGIPLVTVDGPDARDFDDAVFCEPGQDGGWRLLVAIADVGHYVRPGDPLDTEAAERGNSVYFPQQVVPMLPEVLSNGLCSINPRVDRLCMVCALEIDSAGEINRFRFFEGVMRSARRLTYDEFAQAAIERDAQTRERFKALTDHLDDLNSLYQLLRQARERRGALDFGSAETVVEFGPDRKISRIVPFLRHDAHRMIEECMIAANVAAARFLSEHRIPALYRVHAPPSTERLEELRAFLGGFGLSLGGGDKPTPQDYSKVLSALETREDRHLIEPVLLRSLSRAEYTVSNDGHFGLSLAAYTHFTSPIRRYPDLIVHRGIRHVLQGGTVDNYPLTTTELERIAEQCSLTERRADEATRDVADWLKCEFMLERVGEVFEGRINAVTGFGLFVLLDEVFVEGLVHVTSLSNDYYQHDPIHHRLRGERSGHIYRLGDRIRVRLIQVNLDERKIDFELAPPEKGQEAGDGTEARAQKRRVPAPTASESSENGEKGKRRRPRKRRKVKGKEKKG